MPSIQTILHEVHVRWQNSYRQRDIRSAVKKSRRYMTEMAIDPIYPKMNLSKRQHNAMILPYLLKNADIQRPNQAWSIDITYIRMKHGFLYLTAIIDRYSRCIVGWDLDDTLDTNPAVLL